MAFDKKYAGTLAYPKQVISPDDMSANEQRIYDSIISALSPSICVDDLVVEQRNGDYRTVVYKDWDNDFLRYHLSPDDFWISVRMYKPLMTMYQDDPLFEAQYNKRQFHWKASVSQYEISKLADVMVASCQGFFGEFDSGILNAPKKSSEDKLRAAIEILRETSGETRSFLAGRRFELVIAHDIVLAGCKYHEASSQVADGTVLVCRHDRENQYDNQAVGVYYADGNLVGYLPAKGPTKMTVFDVISEGKTPFAIITQDGTDGGTRIKRKKIHAAIVLVDES